MAKIEVKHPQFEILNEGPVLHFKNSSKWEDCWWEIFSSSVCKHMISYWENEGAKVISFSWQGPCSDFWLFFFNFCDWISFKKIPKPQHCYKPEISCPSTTHFAFLKVPEVIQIAKNWKGLQEFPEVFSNQPLQKHQEQKLILKVILKFPMFFWRF